MNFEFCDCNFGFLSATLTGTDFNYSCSFSLGNWVIMKLIFQINFAILPDVGWLDYGIKLIKEHSVSQLNWQ